MNLKTRGYGIVVLDINRLKFGLPLRSNAPHKFCHRFHENKSLDYSKAVIIEKESHVGEPFLIPPEEFLKIKEKSKHIELKFSKYVERYIKFVQNGDHHLLRRDYKYSTLQNYHLQLGIEDENK